MGTPNSVIQLMQKVWNTTARLILRASHHQNCTPLLQQLHWLLISEWINYKTACTLQCNHRFCPLLSFWATAPLQSFPLSPLFIRHTHAQTPTLQPMAFALFHTSVPTSGTISPKTSGTLLISLPSKANSRRFSYQNISVKQHCRPPPSVCTVCVYMCVHLLHSYAWTLVDVYIMC